MFLDSLPPSLNIFVIVIVLITDIVSIPTSAMITQTSIQYVFLLSLLNISKIHGHQVTGLGLKVEKAHISI